MYLTLLGEGVVLGEINKIICFTCGLKDDISVIHPIALILGKADDELVEALEILLMSALAPFLRPSYL